MYFKISNKQMLKKYNQIWKRIEKLINKQTLTANLFMIMIRNT